MTDQEREQTIKLIAKELAKLQKCDWEWASTRQNCISQVCELLALKRPCENKNCDGGRILSLHGVFSDCPDCKGTGYGEKGQGASGYHDALLTAYQDGE